MKIGIIGGTGGMGKGFTLRWCKKHEVIIGSRDAERAATAASEYLGSANDAYGTGGGVAIFVGLMSDSSLVRTSTALATGTAVGASDEEYVAVYLLGPSAPGTVFPAVSGG